MPPGRRAADKVAGLIIRGMEPTGATARLVILVVSEG